MRESRTYGSVRGARDETRVPTATHGARSSRCSAARRRGRSRRARSSPGECVRTPRVGILNYAAARDQRVDEFRNALRELGYMRGRTLLLTIAGPTDAWIVCRSLPPNWSRAMST